MDGLGEFKLGLCMQNVVRHMRKVRSARRQFADPFGRLVEVRVRRMRLLAQCIEDDDLNAFKQREALVRNVVHVRQVRCIAEAKTGDFKVTVHERDPLKESAIQLHRFAKTLQVDAGFVGVWRIGREGVIENSFEDESSAVVRIQRQMALLVEEGERPKIIQAEDVIGVGMGIEVQRRCDA